MDWYIVVITFLISSQGVAIPQSVTPIYKAYEDRMQCNADVAKIIRNLPRARADAYKEVKMFHCEQKKANADE